MIFRTLQRLLPPAAALLLAGCGMMRQGAMGLVAPVADNLAVSLQRQTDLQLVEDGVPALILLLDGLVLSAPDNSELRLAAADAYTSYAGAFTNPDDKARAAELFGRAKTYALDVLGRNKRFKAALNDPRADFDAVVKTFRKRDVPALYAAATAWTGWIISNSDSVAATADLPRAMALMQRVMDLDRGYRQGGADTFFGIYSCILPRGAGQDLPKAREHFESALRYAGPGHFFPQVTYAEFYARYAFDRELHDRLLNDVLTRTDTPPDAGLMNAVARKRARALLAAADEWF
ncbi:MAG: TRAP transporter TatT component family protein [Kiritimatiellia bacterium]